MGKSQLSVLYTGKRLTIIIIIIKHTDIEIIDCSIVMQFTITKNLLLFVKYIHVQVNFSVPFYILVR